MKHAHLWSNSYQLKPWLKSRVGLDMKEMHYFVNCLAWVHWCGLALSCVCGFLLRCVTTDALQRSFRRPRSEPVKRWKRAVRPTEREKAMEPTWVTRGSWVHTSGNQNVNLHYAHALSKLTPPPPLIDSLFFSLLGKTCHGASANSFSFCFRVFAYKVTGSQIIPIFWSCWRAMMQKIRLHLTAFLLALS